MLRCVFALICLLPLPVSAQVDGTGVIVRQGGEIVALSYADAPGPVVRVREVVLQPAPFVLEVPHGGCPVDQTLVQIRVLPPPAENYSGLMNEVILDVRTGAAMSYLFPDASGFAEYEGPVRTLLMSGAVKDAGGWGFHYLFADRLAQWRPDVAVIAVDKVIAEDRNLLIAGAPFVMMIGVLGCEPMENAVPFDLIAVTFTAS